MSGQESDDRIIATAVYTLKNRDVMMQIISRKERKH